jgi:hypothetical protein
MSSILFVPSHFYPRHSSSLYEDQYWSRRCPLVVQSVLAG